MKLKFLSIISALLLVSNLTGCKSPEEFVPTDSVGGNECFESFTAYFTDEDRIGENEFPAEINYAAKTICVVIPYNYPRTSDNVLTDVDITRMRVVASLKKSCSIEGGIKFMDLSKDNYITVVDGSGLRTQFRVYGEIRKSAECSILEYNLPDAGIGGVVNENALLISLITPEQIGEAIAQVELSHGATIDPDPTAVALNYDDPELTVTVTAQDGVHTQTYTFTTAEPEKLVAGVRPGSAKIAWAKRLIDVQCSGSKTQAGLGVLEDYIIVNEVGTMNAVYLNRKNGNVVGTVDISAVGFNGKGQGNNYQMTSDKAGNVLINNNCNPNDPDIGGTLNIWRMRGIEGNPQLYISCQSNYQVGNRVSVDGDLDGDAVITAPLNGTSIAYLRWIVRGGQLLSQTPDFVDTGAFGTCWGNADVHVKNPSDPAGSDSWICAYAGIPAVGGGRGCAWLDSGFNIVAANTDISTNWVENAIDGAAFNKIYVVAHNSINTFTWGADDMLYVYDTSGLTMNNFLVDFKELNFANNYGAKAAGAVAGEASNGGDCRVWAAKNGFYLYIYFMYSKGFVGCVQIDCIDM